MRIVLIFNSFFIIYIYIMFSIFIIFIHCGIFRISEMVLESKGCDVIAALVLQFGLSLLCHCVIVLTVL